MDFSAFAKRAGKIAADNSPAILTAIGATGVLTTAYLTGKATFKAAEIIQEAQEKENAAEKGHSLEVKEKFDLVWKLYLPATGMAALSIAAMICANHISTRRAAALASAYSIGERAFEEYKKKVVDKIGDKKEQAVRDEIAQDRVNNHPLSKSKLVVIDGGSTLCLDLHSGRYFNSDMETLRKAVNDLNAQVIAENYASLTDFWGLIGLPQTSESDEIGWSTDKLLEAEFSAAISEDGRPCITIGFRTTPVRGYCSFR